MVDGEDIAVPDAFQATARKDERLSWKLGDAQPTGGFAETGQEVVRRPGILIGADVQDRRTSELGLSDRVPSSQERFVPKASRCGVQFCKRERGMLQGQPSCQLALIGLAGQEGKRQRHAIQAACIPIRPHVVRPREQAEANPDEHTH